MNEPLPDWLQLRRAAQLVPGRWRNGLGRSLELACGGPLEDPDWRISCAWIDATAAYSDYTGFERLQVLLEGGPLQLDHGSAPFGRLEAPGSRLRFDGGLALVAHAETPCTVLNGFARHGLYQVDAWLRPLLGAMMLPPTAGGSWVGWLLAGTAKLRYGSDQLLLQRGDGFRLDHAAQPRVVLDGGGSIALAQVRRNRQ